MENSIFDKEFQQKLKAFYSFDEGERTKENKGYRCTGRTTILARILLETAIESGREIVIQDHYLDRNGGRHANHDLKMKISKYVSELRNRGIAIDFEMTRRGESFRARILGHPGIGESAISSSYGYEYIRTSPFPIQQLQQRKEFLNKQLLLLL